MSNNPGTTERIGVTSFMQTEQFVMGMMTYLNGLSRMNKQTEEFAGNMTGKLTQGSKTASAAMAGGAQQAGLMEQTLGSLSLKAIALAGTLLYLAHTALTALINKAKELVMGGLEVAGRIQEMDFVLQILGQRVGKTAEEMRGLVSDIIEFGVRTDVAQKVVSQFIRYQLDLAKATSLVSVAQDAAVIAGADTSDMVDRMLLGIQRYDREILRMGGIDLPATDIVFQKFADTLGTTAEALTAAQKQQAFLDATIEAGAINAGAYAAAMEAPGKQLRSLVRDQVELNRAIGTPFLSAYAQVIKMMRSVTQSFTAAIDVGGPLHEMFLTIGAVALLFAEQLRTAVENGVTFLINGLAAIPDVFSHFIEYITGLATDAGDWGANIITNLASGMLAAAGAVIDALIYIGGIITSWLIPGSPPKLLPDLGKWGASAATEWVKGWGSADFSTFNDIAKTVEGFIRTMDIDEKNLIPTLLGSREAIADAINMVSEAGMVTEEALDRIMNSVSGLPSSFRDYARAMLEVESANQRLVAASEQYNAANDITLENADATIAAFSGELKTAAEDYVDALEQAINVNNALGQAQEELNYITYQYDSILSALKDELDSLSGAGDDSRLNEINEAIATGMLTQSELAELETEKRQLELKKQIALVEDQRDAEVDAAEERIDMLAMVREAAISQAEIMKSTMLEIAGAQVTAAQAQQDALQEQLETQKALIAFQTEQNDLVKQQIALLERLAAALAGGAGGLDPSEITGGGEVDLDAIDKGIQEKIEKMKNMMKAKFFLFLNTLKTNIILFFNKLPIYQELKKKFDKLKETWGPALEALRTWFEVNIPTAITFFTNIWDTKLVPAFIYLKEIYDTYVAPALIALFGFLTEHGAEILAFVVGFEAVGAAVLGFITVAAGVPALIAGISAAIATVTGLFIALTSPIGLIAIAVGLLAAAWTGNWFGMRDTLIEFWTVTVQPALATLWEWLSVNIPLAIETLRSWWEGTLLPAFQNVWAWVTENIFPLFTTLWEWLSTKVPEAIETLRSWWEDTLLPAFQTAHAWFTETYFPFWEALGNLLSVIVTAAIGSLQEKWDDMKAKLTTFWTWLSGTFKPIWDDIKEALDKIWDSITANLNPAFTTMATLLLPIWTKLHSLWNLLENTLFGTLNTFYNDWLLNIHTAFKDITIALQQATAWFIKLANAINGVPEPPKPYVPGSPTPFESGLLGIRKQMQAMYMRDLPKFGAQLSKLPQIGSINSIPSGRQGSNSTVNNFNKNIQLEVNANYAKQQSLASVRYDVSAALNYV